MDGNKIGMILVTIIQIPSFCCAVQILLRFAQRTSPLRRLQNHLLICLVIIATWTISIELPNTQKYLWSSSASIHSNWFCVFWNVSFLSMATLNRVLMAFMSIERHFLAFRPQFYHTRRSRLLFHYIPLIFLISFVLIYNFVTNIFISCPQESFNYSLFLCGYTCAFLLQNVGLVHAWMLVFTPTVMTIIACILLPIRFIIQKRQLQRVQWHRARKMIVQTSMIAGAYTICWLPYTILLQLLLNNILSFFDPNIGRYLLFTPYVTSLMTPFIVFHTMPGQMNFELMKRIKHRFFPQRQGVVRPNINCVVQHVNHFSLEEPHPIEQ